MYLTQDCGSGSYEFVIMFEQFVSELDVLISIPDLEP
jgi:hypothetical protein